MKKKKVRRSSRISHPQLEVRTSLEFGATIFDSMTCIALISGIVLSVLVGDGAFGTSITGIFQKAGGGTSTSHTGIDNTIRKPYDPSHNFIGED